MSTPAEGPLYRLGKICYLEIPARDVAESAQFYQQVFGWRIRRHEDGSTAFDDTVGQVSGMWVLDRQPSRDLGLMVHIMVANVVIASAAIVGAGGEIVQSFDGAEVYAYFRDPAGNLLGIYQERALADHEAQKTDLPHRLSRQDAQVADAIQSEEHTQAQHDTPRRPRCRPRRSPPRSRLRLTCSSSKSKPCEGCCTQSMTSTARLLQIARVTPVGPL